MRVVYQNCGCVSLPDEIVSALGLSSGSLLEISYSAEMAVATLSVIDPHNLTSEKPPESCRIRTPDA